jgi:hypothetical protein
VHTVYGEKIENRAAFGIGDHPDAGVRPPRRDGVHGGGLPRAQRAREAGRAAGRFEDLVEAAARLQARRNSGERDRQVLVQAESAREGAFVEPGGRPKRGINPPTMAGSPGTKNCQARKNPS